MRARVGTSPERMKEASRLFRDELRGAAGCSRCGGFLVVEPYYDCRVQRCVQCGDLLDPVILQNRLHRLDPKQRPDRVGLHPKAA
jgi:hypothetical protein